VEDRRATVRELYSFFEEKLKNGKIILGTEKGVWDTERKPTETIVIHHTGGDPGLTPERLSAMELFRLYLRHYAHPYDTGRWPPLAGAPISSGHTRNDQQVFYPYHWLVRMDGSAERLLYDNEVGWHAGNWRVNCQSVAIALDNNYENSVPSKVVLRTVAELITSYYQFVPKNQIVGHREVKRTMPGTTTCPGQLFLSHDSQRGWKEDLLDLI
jgi:hypothetical protein